MSAAAPSSAALLLGNYRPALQVAEFLRSREMYVMCGIEGSDHCAQYSRFVDEMWDHPPMSEGPDVFLSALQKLAEDRPEITLIIPLEEAFVRLIAERRKSLPAGPHFATVADELVKTCLDKPALLKQAKAAGLPVAPFHQVRSLSELDHALKDLGYPVVVRPWDSTKRLFGRKAVTLDGDPARQSWFATWPADQEAMLIQRKVQGVRHNCYFAACNGKIERYLHATITRTDHFDGSGLAVEGETIEPDPSILAFNDRLIKRLDYSGIGCAQYLVDTAEQTVFFLEINPRIAGNHAVPEFCGVELCQFLVDGGGSDEGSIRCGRSGVRYSWIAGDLEGLKSGLKQREIGPDQAAVWLARCLRNAVSSNLDMTFRLRDPIPGLVNLVDVVPGIGHLTRLRRNRAAPRLTGQIAPGNAPISSGTRKAWR